MRLFSLDQVKYDERGLIPAIIQDSNTRVVLMQAYMNKESLEKTLAEKLVCFFSRSKGRLWTKGEESGNFLTLVSIAVDCDGDSLLIKVIPKGVVCHTGSDTCWEETNISDNFLYYLESYLNKRKDDSPEDSYTARLISRGMNKVSQKVGEEAVELVIEALNNDKDLFLNEAADLMYHYIVLLIAKGFSLGDVENILSERHGVPIKIGK